jgi:molybdopterin converting factor subunit 1
MRVTVKLFGSLREAVGDKELGVELPDGARVSELRDLLVERYPAFDQLGPRIAVSVNFELADLEQEQSLSDGDEVAFLPPVSGGIGNCTISEKALDEREVVARVAGDDTGGVVSFVGTVRNHARGQSIRYLEYEAYPEMAEREMQKIADEASRRWPGTRLAIAHRTGHLAIGDAAVVVAACAPHRGEAFEACRYAIDTLKVTVPIWKKEVAESGEYWVDDHA